MRAPVSSRLRPVAANADLVAAGAGRDRVGGGCDVAARKGAGAVAGQRGAPPQPNVSLTAGWLRGCFRACCCSRSSGSRPGRGRTSSRCRSDTARGRGGRGRAGGRDAEGAGRGVRLGHLWARCSAMPEATCAARQAARCCWASRWPQAAAAVACEKRPRRAASAGRSGAGAGPAVRGGRSGGRRLIQRDSRPRAGAKTGRSARGQNGLGDRGGGEWEGPARGEWPAKADRPWGSLGQTETAGFPARRGARWAAADRSSGKGRACPTPRGTAARGVASGRRRQPREDSVGPRELSLGAGAHLGLVALGGPARVHAAARRASRDASPPGRLHRAPHASRGRRRGPLATVARRARHHWTARSSRGCAGVLRARAAPKQRGQSDPQPAPIWSSTPSPAIHQHSRNPASARAARACSHP